MNAERDAKNQALFREVNEHIAEVGTRLVAGDTQSEWEFLCECGDTSCVERMVVPIHVYRDVRENGRRFILLPGHENLAVERVVERQPAYLIAEIFAEVGEVGEARAGGNGERAPLTAPPA